MPTLVSRPIVSFRRLLVTPLLLLAGLAAACGRDTPLLSPDGGPRTANAPQVSSLAPSTAVAGAAGLTLTVDGRSFTRLSVVRWAGKDLPTTYVSKWQLRAAVGAAELAAGGAYEVRVFTPGESVSPAATFTVTHPVPQITRLAPDSATIGTPGAEVTIDGSGFAPASVARWNGADRPTRFVSATQIAVTLSAADLQTASHAAVTVFNPAPGGGVSAADTFVVGNPVPRIAYLHTRGATAGAGGFDLTVTGERFLATSVVHWNGAPRTTTWLSATRLRASLTADDLAAAGVAAVTVVSPGPGGGASNAAALSVRNVGGPLVSSQVRLPLPVRDVVYDEGTRRLYATVYSGPSANSIAIIDPVTATVEETVFIGSGPRYLAPSSDGQFLYVGLDGSNSVRRFDIATRTAGPEFALGVSRSGYPLVAEDIAVMPDSPHVVAVALRNLGLSPKHEGVAVFDHGVKRAVQTPGHTGSNVIEFGDAPGVLWGQNNETTEDGFRRMRVDASGVTITNVTTGLIAYGYEEIAFAAGRVYSNSGPVIDPDRAMRVGACPSTGGVRPDVETGRLFMLSEQGIGVCDVNTFRVLGTIPVIPYISFEHPYNQRVHVVRWANDGLAYHDADELIIIRSPIAAP
ncbi:MAG TPA: IPT/TIG domain-containing protein [Longimicrobium sp.]|nr:IPT/TIG domain-containing protein [Longimicrobium sp.]